MNITNFKKKLVIGQKIRITSPYGGVMNRETVIEKVKSNSIGTDSPREPGQHLCWMTLPKASEITEITDTSVKFVFADMQNVGKFMIELL